ncbi:arginase family protein [Candidatus Hodarchaeum mangrovi]
MKSLDFVIHDSEMLCGIISKDFSEEEANFNLIGTPLDITSTYRSGSRMGPNSFRNILYSDNFECVTESGVDLKKHYRIKDYGNIGIIPHNLSKSLQFISEGILDFLKLSLPFLVIGGDHSTSIGVAEALEENSHSFYLIYLDAHLDLYDNIMENPKSHACTLRRITEKTTFQGATVLGYRDFSLDQIKYAKKVGLEIFSTDNLMNVPNLYNFGFQKAKALISKYPHIYVSIDLDLLDPGVAPGVGNPVAGGISSRQLFWMIQGLFKGLGRSHLIGWDIVEYNPLYDHSEITAFIMTKLLIEGLGSLISID